MPRPRLTTEQILEWARAHRARKGKWPSQRSGPVEGAPGETWVCVETALRDGLRGLPGGDSLARLLARGLGVRNRSSLPRLLPGQVLAWAEAHRRRTGRWPSAASGPVADAPGENWQAINLALYQGYRGLPGGDSLAWLLDRERRRPRGLARGAG